MNCIKAQCRSPVACGGFGYCREINVEVSQHLGWLKQYMAAMTANNWEDMRLLANRQLDRISAVVGTPSGAGK